MTTDRIVWATVGAVLMIGGVFGFAVGMGAGERFCSDVAAGLWLDGLAALALAALLNSLLPGSAAGPLLAAGLFAIVAHFERKCPGVGDGDVARGALWALIAILAGVAVIRKAAPPLTVEEAREPPAGG
jgi:hypothetical protein